MTTEFLRIHDLDLLLRKAKSPKSPLLVLLHGYGADCHDLFPLEEMFDEDQCFHFACINAPLEIPIGFGQMGRAWFPIDERILMGTMPRKDYVPQGLGEVVDKVSKVLNSMLEELDAKHLILGGFSQGAMMAMELLMSKELPLKGLLLLSGTMIHHEHWLKHKDKLKDLMVFQSHGKQDPILPYQDAAALSVFIKDHGAKSEFFSFGGGHEIPVPVIDKVTSFLGACL